MVKILLRLMNSHFFKNVKWDDFSSAFGTSVISLFSTKHLETASINLNESPFNNLDIETKKIISIGQTHSKNIRISNTAKFYNDADGIINPNGELICSIKVADCLPVYFSSKVSNTIGLAHAGWRGLVNGVLLNMLSGFSKIKTDLGSITVLIGPSINSCCFFVKDDILDLFDKSYIVKEKNKSFSIDLRKMAIDQMVNNGIRFDNIISIDRCTYCDNDRYHSFRREGSKAGRMQAILSRVITN